MTNLEKLTGNMDAQTVARLLIRGWTCNLCPARTECCSGSCCMEALTRWLEAES